MKKKLKSLKNKILLFFIELYEKFEKLNVALKIGVIIIAICIFEILIATSFQLITNFFDKSVKISYEFKYPKTLLSENLENEDYIKHILKVEIHKDTQDDLVQIALYKYNNDIDVFTKIKTYSFITHYEPILIAKKIPYKWQISNYKQFPITSFIVDESLRILLFLFIIFILEKQGLFGNREKYSIIYPSAIDGDLKDLKGMAEIKQEVLILADLINNKKKYKQYGIEKGFNYLFSGPPGTGKTRIASYLAKILDVPLVIGTGNVETGYINGGVKVIQDLFSVARNVALDNANRMVIVFLDEAQTLMVKRGQSREKWADDSANELLAQLDGIHTFQDVDIIFIAASNFDDKNHVFDEAMMRRFKKKIYFRLPNFEERMEILEYYLNKLDSSVKHEDLNLNYLADITSNLSPATLETIVQEACLLALTQHKELDNETYDKNKVKEEEILVKINTELLTSAFERIIIGHTNRKTTDKQEKERALIAYHELGHFFCHLYFTFQKYLMEKQLPSNEVLEKYVVLEDFQKFLRKHLNVLKISIESISQINALGYVLNKNDEINLKNISQLEEEIISLYGGLSAEIVFYGKNNLTTGSSNDIEKVTQILDFMYNKINMYGDNKLNFSLISIDEKNKHLLIERMNEKSKELSKMSEKIIFENKALINYLQVILLDKYVLNLDQIIEHLSNFSISQSK